MEVIYKKSFFTKISEYQLQMISIRKDLNKIVLERYVADKDDDPAEKVNIHPHVLNDLIMALEESRDLLGIKKDVYLEKMNQKDKSEIQRRYLRGISINDLCIQFNKKPQTIENILLEGNIEIIPEGKRSNKRGKSYAQSHFRRRKP